MQQEVWKSVFAEESLADILPLKNIKFACGEGTLMYEVIGVSSLKEWLTGY